MESIGNRIAKYRKEKALTQEALAEKMGVTDKAVSKWERDLSYPDINSIPKLAEIFGVSVDELMQVKTETKENISKNKIDGIVDTILKGIGVAMGIAVTVLSVDIKSVPNIIIGQIQDGDKTLNFKWEDDGTCISAENKLGNPERPTEDDTLVKAI